MSLTLYHYWRSSCSWRLRWALKHKGISYEAKAINLLEGKHLEPAYLAINPAGSVPCLVSNGNVMTESMAIIEWLEEIYPQNPLLPSDVHLRFKARQLALAIVSGIQPIQNLKVLKYISEQQDERTRFAKHWIGEGLKQFERLLDGTAGKYCVGNELSIADLCLTPQIYNARRFNVDLDKFPKALAISERCLALSACFDSAPEQQADAVK